MASANFCSTTFWDLDLLTDPHRPDFTDCFHSTLLIYAPCLFLWLFIPYYFITAKSIIVSGGEGRVRKKSFSLLFCLKCLGLVSLGAVVLIGLVRAIVVPWEEQKGYARVRLVTPILVLATLIYEGGCLWIHWRCGHIRYVQIRYLKVNNNNI